MSKFYSYHKLIFSLKALLETHCYITLHYIWTPLSGVLQCAVPPRSSGLPSSIKEIDRMIVFLYLNLNLDTLVLGCDAMWSRPLGAQGHQASGSRLSLFFCRFPFWVNGGAMVLFWPVLSVRRALDKLRRDAMQVTCMNFLAAGFSPLFSLIKMRPALDV